MKQLLAVVVATVALNAWAHDENSTPPVKDPAVAPPPAQQGDTQPTVVQSGETKTSEIIHTVEDAKELTGFQIGADLDHWLGTGTFVNPDLYSSLTLAITASPAYSFKIGDVKLRATGLFRLLYEYTLPDNETGRRITPWDIRLGLSAPAVVKEKVTGISLSPSIGLSIPTTPESWQAGLITSLSAGVSLSRSGLFGGKLDLAASFSGSHGFFTSPQNNNKASGQQTTVVNNVVVQPTVLCRTGESICNSVGMNTEWTVTTGGSINFHATDRLIVSLAYSYIHYWKYGVGVDQYSPQVTDSNGNQVAAGTGQADRTFGVIGVGYDLSEHYNVSVSASTIQTPRTMGAGGQAGSFKFPFWSTTPADNNTSLNFTLSAQY
ncbi:MAG: hypothetical protein QM723_21065 [Myxococcaceae bacterium]